MGLLVLVGIVGFGIALIVLLVHWAGGSRRPVLGTPDQVAERYRIDFPDAEIVRCLESADGYEALLVLADGGLGLVHAIGSKSLTRHYRRDAFAAMIGVHDDASLAFDPHEMTLPPLVIRFETPERRAEAMAALGLAAPPVLEAA